MNDLPSVPGGVVTPPAAPLKSFYHQAATSSVWLLLFPFVIQFVSVAALSSLSPRDAVLPRLFFALAIAMGMLGGVVLGIISLFGIPKYGTKGILIKSLFGILIPVLLFLVSLPVILKAKALAERNAQAAEHPSR